MLSLTLHDLQGNALPAVIPPRRAYPQLVCVNIYGMLRYYVRRGGSTGDGCDLYDEQKPVTAIVTQPNGNGE